MAGVIAKSVTKVYPGGVEAVKQVSLEVNDREFLVLVGPSGCGKSTFLRMIAGLEEITEGEIFIGERLVNDLPPKDRDIAMVFQNYALYPHMTVRKNLAFGLKLRKYPEAEIEERVREAAEILEINELLDRKPKQLSGGGAPAGRRRPGHRPQAAGIPLRRTPLQPRRQTPRPDADGDQQAPP